MAAQLPGRVQSAAATGQPVVWADALSVKARASRYNLEPAPAFGESGFAAPVVKEPVVTDIRCVEVQLHTGVIERFT